MLQEWADMVDAWIDERTHVPKLMLDTCSNASTDRRSKLRRSMQ